MEEKKLDLNSIIGFVLIFGILLYMLWQNQPTPEEIEAQKAKQEQLAKEKNKEESQEQSSYQISPDDLSNMSGSDSTKLAVLKNKFGAFAYGAGLETGQDAITEVKTDLLTLKFNSKGGFLSEVKLNKFVNYDSVPIYLINDNNSVFNITFGTSDNRTLNTKDLYFQPQVTNNGDKTIVSMKLKVSENEFLEHRYEIANDDYMIGLTLRSQGLSSVINSSQNMVLDWRMKTFRHDQSIVYENRYTRLTYQHDGGNKIDKLAQGGDDEEEEKDVSWISYRQHFFSTILVPDTPFKSVKLASRTLVKNEDIDTVYTKEYASKLALNISGGELSQPMKLYFGPTDSKILKKYENNLEESIPFGWGIFGWINKALFIPLFGFLSSIMPYGLAIIAMTILIKLLLSFVQYKQFLSQAKMRILKPEIDAIRTKHKDNTLKAQQEIMALQNKAGASPLSGCLPGLMQIPVFYALFMFFPAAFDLRQKSFLWADDLSSYDVIAELPFNIPLYGGHVSLFPILAAIAIFFYMKMTTGDQVAAQPQQEGMPDMGKIMKIMIYL
ncbi:MAG TPA: membrane protein insertase YidC, partial [Aquaticitalea sp.]|nr:membrane protein insertase YidC [Aquaticitalea sp.]